jgi:NAD(P)-dependent dehydrogenase (short-subunit alcohol dehydrogenase family)
VVNLVGGFAQGGRVHETPVEDFEAQLRLNLRPTYVVTARGAPGHAGRGHGRDRVRLVARRAAPVRRGGGLRDAPRPRSWRSSTRSTRSTARTASAPTRSCPSTIDTPANRAASPDADHSRWVAPEQIAHTSGYLCSRESTAISGAHVPVYGRA